MDLIPVRDGIVDTSCSDYVADTVRWLESAKPAHIVIAMATLGYLTSDSYTFEDPVTHTSVRGSDQKETALRSSLVDILTRLRKAGHEVTLVHQAPQLPGYNPRSCLLFELLASRGSACSVSVPRAQVDQQMDRAWALESSAADLADVDSISFDDALCGPDFCRALQGERWMYRDSAHLSVAGAETLRPAFARILEPHNQHGPGVVVGSSE